MVQDTDTMAYWYRWHMYKMIIHSESYIFDMFFFQSSNHDPSWLRRPRSRTHSRGTTPPPSARHHLPSLSRQSSLSMSMDELNSPAMQRRRLASAGTRRQQQARANGGGGGGRSAMSRRQRAAAMTNSAGMGSFTLRDETM